MRRQDATATASKMLALRRDTIQISGKDFFCFA
jgi:hypothetical protein